MAGRVKSEPLSYRWRRLFLLGVQLGLHRVGYPEHVLVFVAEEGVAERRRLPVRVLQRHRRPRACAQDAEVVTAQAAIQTPVSAEQPSSVPL